MRSNHVRMGLWFACAVVALEATATALPITGPMFDESTGTGYQHVGESYFSIPVPTAGNGVAIGTPAKFTNNVGIDRRPVRYTAAGNVVELGTLGGGETWAWAINKAGTSAGSSRKLQLGYRAVRWDANSSDVTELGNLGTDSSGYATNYANAINSAGTIVGEASKYVGGTGFGTRAVRWNASGTVATELGHIGTNSSGFTTSKATAINDAGTIVGQSERYINDTPRGTSAVRWNANQTTATELGNLGTNLVGFTRVEVHAINSAGTSVGMAQKYDPNSVSPNVSLGDRPVRWAATGTAATELDVLDTDHRGHGWSTAYAINAKGTVVGNASKFSEDGTLALGSRAVRWNASGTAVTELGHLGTGTNGAGGLGYTASNALAINRKGVAVGFARKYVDDTSFGTYRAVAWGPDSTEAVDLNTLLSPADAERWTLTGAGAISDNYWVTGYSTFDPDGEAGPLESYQRDFLLDVVRAFGIPGDATRDDRVSFDDLLTLAHHYGQGTGLRWDDGDFSGDGLVNFTDLLAMAQNYGVSANVIDSPSGGDFAVDWALAQSMVPEPASAALCLGAGLVLRRRSRAM